jgi:hypothetical protein
MQAETARVKHRSTLCGLPVLLVLSVAAPRPASASRDLVAPEHGAVPMHDRPRRVVVSLTANEVRRTRAERYLDDPLHR